MAKQLKKWQGWLLFGGAMVVVFILGLICSSLLERRAEVASIFNNRRTPMTDSVRCQIKVHNCKCSYLCCNIILLFSEILLLIEFYFI